MRMAPILRSEIICSDRGRRVESVPRMRASTYIRMRGLRRTLKARAVRLLQFLLYGGILCRAIASGASMLRGESRCSMRVSLRNRPKRSSYGVFDQPELNSQAWYFYATGREDQAPLREDRN